MNLTNKELWFVHLATRPMVYLKFECRGEKFASLSKDESEIQVQSVPWGEEMLFRLFTFEYIERVNMYAIKAWNNMYLTWDGRLSPKLVSNCYLEFEYHDGLIALRDALKKWGND